MTPYGNYCKCHTSVCICKTISSRTLVSLRNWIRKEVVFYLQRKPEGEWDRVAEWMMIKFRESGHPVFRATSPLSRGTLKSKGGQLSIHLCADEGSIETVFRTIMFVSSVFTEQSQMCVKNAILVKQERGDLYWQDNMIHCSRQQTY